MPDADPTPDAPADDLALLQRAKQGDFSAFEALALKYERRVFALARRLVSHHEDAEEVVQQTFLSVIEHLSEFRGESSFYTWLMRIATNHGLALLRRRAIRATVPLEPRGGDEDYGNTPHPDYIAVWRDTPDQLATQNETRRYIEEALAELDEKYRLVFVLRDIEGFSTEETAEALGISTNNVKVRLMRARLMLREKLTRVFGDESTRVQPHEHE